MGYIYSIKNKLNGWEYIGMTTRTPVIRYESNYGAENFVLSRIYNGITLSKEELQDVEIWNIVAR